MKASSDSHQVERLRTVLLGGMHRHFRRRQREDQPAVAGIDVREFENVAQEGAIGIGILAVNDDVCTVDHDHRDYYRRTITAMETSSSGARPPVKRFHSPTNVSMSVVAEADG